MTDAELDGCSHERLAYQTDLCRTPTRASIVALAHEHGMPLASHDDTTRRACRRRRRATAWPSPSSRPRSRPPQACTQAGIAVLMGAPNVVRGGSHSGNIAAVDLARAGLLDILSSDYVPSSLLMARAATAAARSRPSIWRPRSAP